jgi:hypothetical protein
MEELDANGEIRRARALPRSLRVARRQEARRDRPARDRMHLREIDPDARWRERYADVWRQMLASQPREGIADYMPQCPVSKVIPMFGATARRAALDPGCVKTLEAVARMQQKNRACDLRDSFMRDRPSVRINVAPERPTKWSSHSQDPKRTPAPQRAILVLIDGSRTPR